ncbi:MAG: transposase [Pirellulales bacterium]
MAKLHRKHCKRYDIVGDAHALTYSCFHRLPLLSRDRSRRWMIEGLQHGRETGMFDLWAFVVMPEHVHLLIYPRAGVRMSSILNSVKQSVAQRALRWLKANEPSYLRRLEDVQPNGQRAHRFWQRGGGYDRNLVTISDVHEKIAYFHNNPVRRGLVARASDWYWSSCAAWETGIDEPIAIDREFLRGKMVIGS